MTNDPNAANSWRPIDPAQPEGFGQPAASPTGQPMQPYSMPSAENPYSMPSAEIPYSQPSAPMAQPSAVAQWEHTAPIPTGYPSAAQPYTDEYTGVVPGMTGLNRPTAPVPPKQQSPVVAALTDFGFTRFGARDVAKIAYVAVIIMALVNWITSIVYGFVGSFDTDLDGSTWAGLGALMLGWIPAVVTILLVRLVLEAIVAVVDIRQKDN